MSTVLLWQELLQCHMTQHIIYKCNVKDLDMEGQGSELGGLMTSGVNGSYTIEESNVNNVNINFNTTKW